MTEHDEDAVVERIARRNAECTRAENWDDVDDERKASYRHDARVELQDIVDCLKPGDRLPGGLRVVPEEPTVAMVEAASGHLFGDGHDPASIYDAMLAASAD